jgi:molybdenum cofactor cytidylyltransferase
MISAIILAAGQSTRMGRQKMVLPWGETTVIGKVVATLLEAGIFDIHVISGGYPNELKAALKEFDLDFIFNKDYANREMLTSVQVGLRFLGEAAEAALIVLGDQPQIASQIVQAISKRYYSTQPAIIIPSYKMHRGHPWLVKKTYWQEILELIPPHTLQDFLNIHKDDIDYVIVDTPSVIQDLDTQDDYAIYKP